MYCIKTVLQVKSDLKTVWDFYSTPSNLSQVTPDNIGFKMLSELPESMYVGMVLRYRISPIARIPMQWATEITHIEPYKYFVDHQLEGPYKIWHHQHHFREIEGGVEIEDIVHYALPLGPLGTLAHHLFVKKQIQSIFQHREQTTNKIFGRFE
jgi:ligand-binding SRPBCC domain-containing protein